LLGAGHAAADRLLTQAGAKLITGFETGYVSSGIPVANRMALLINSVLGEHAPQIDLAGFGFTIGLFAAPPHQLLRHHGHSGPIRAHVHDRRIASARLGWPFLPSLSR